MIARLRNLISRLGETFWLLPGFLVLASVLAAFGLVYLDHARVIPQYMLDGPWLYNGAATGARTLLGAIASSTIGVAGTVFSITIAALSLAAGQMGPRLLRNFVRDRGNQIVLGALLGTFSYALIVLRSVRGQGEGEFVPHLALSIAILMALVCVGMLVFFVGHMAGRINVDTVIALVSRDIRAAIRRLTCDTRQEQPPPATYWHDATPIRDTRYGYLQQIDEGGLASWAAANGTAIRLLVRPGGYVFPGAVIAVIRDNVEGADAAIRNATALGVRRASSADLEFEIRQLVEVAVRALSSGINDPHTAMIILDRLGEALCEIAPRYLQTGVTMCNDKIALLVPGIDYDGVTDTMFHMIRQNAAGKPAVLIHMLEILSVVLECESNKLRVASLQRHADMIRDDGKRTIGNPMDLADLEDRYRRFEYVKRYGTAAPMA